MIAAPVLARGSFQGVLDIIRFNWSRIVGGVVATLATLVLAVLAREVSDRASVLLLAVGALAAWWCVASLVASHILYDRTSLRGWDWIVPLVPAAPRRWANVTMGFDETSDALRMLFPPDQAVVLDCYDDARMGEASIRRARSIYPSTATSADIRALPLGDASMDAVFVLFAAHEIRDPAERIRFFAQVRRLLAPGGRCVLVEHRRDLANAAVFGPGALHFYSSRAWRGAATAAGLVEVDERAMTPLVRATAFEVGGDRC